MEYINSYHTGIQIFVNLKRELLLHVIVFIDILFWYKDCFIYKCNLIGWRKKK